MKLRRSPTLELVTTVQRARARGEEAFSLSTPTFPTDLPPLPLQSDWGRLTDAAGLPALVDRTRDLLFTRWHAPEHRVIVTGGAKAAIFCLLRALVPPGAAVLVIAPFWPSYEDLAAAATLNMRTVQTDLSNGFAIPVNDVERLAEVSGAGAILLANPNNPTGKTYSRDELQALLDIARRRSLVLILDESFSEFVYDRQAWDAGSIPADPALVVVNSFSKNFHLQGLRLGACLVHRRHFEATVTVHQTILSAAPSLSQHVALALLERGEVAPPDYRAQREMALRFVARAGWRAHPPEGTFYIFPEVRDLETFRREAARRNVHILAGDAFGIPYGRHFRLCFGKPLPELAEIFDRLADLVSSNP
jgi:aminotransferase